MPDLPRPGLGPRAPRMVHRLRTAHAHTPPLPLCAAQLCRAAVAVPVRGGRRGEGVGPGAGRDAVDEPRGREQRRGRRRRDEGPPERGERHGHREGRRARAEQRDFGDRAAAADCGD